MKTLRTVLILVALVVLAAHFSRAGANLLAGMILLSSLLLRVQRPWAGWALRVALAVGGLEWIRTAVRLVGERRAAGDDWTRLVVILGTVSVLTFLASWAVTVKDSRSQDSSSG